MASSFGDPPPTFATNFVGTVGYSEPPPYYQHAEFVGQCLTTPWVAGQTYTVTLDFSQTEGTGNHKISILGYVGNTCPTIPYYAGADGKEELCGKPNWVVLDTFVETASPSDTNWTNVSVTFTVPSNISYVAFGECDYPGAPLYWEDYFIYDNFCLSTVPNSCSFIDTGKTLENCNDNGTPTDGTDDYITFSLNPTGTNLGTTYNVSVDNGGTITPISGTYGSPTTFQLQNGSADGSTTYTITITDAADGMCMTTTTVVQNPCFTAVCSLTDAGKTLEICNNNCTDTDNTDDYITFSLNPTGYNLGTTYNVSVDNGGIITPTSGAYGSPTAFQLQNGSADGVTTYTITIIDDSDSSCTVTITVMQNSCSSTSECVPVLPPTIIDGITITSTQFGDVSNWPSAYTSCGVTTPANSLWLGEFSNFSYTYTFNTPVNDLNFLLTANNAGNGLNETFTFTTSNGAAGVNITANILCGSTLVGNQIGSLMLGPGGGVDFLVNDSIGDFTSITISGPGLNAGSLLVLCSSSLASCSLTCEDKTSETCNNNGTPTDGTDDYITFSLNPTGTSLGATYNVSVDNGGVITPSSGTYGSPTAFRLQNGSADCVTTYTITITDATDPSCTITTTVMQDSCFVLTLNDPNDVCIDGSDMVFTATPVPGTLAGDSGVFTITAGTGFMDNLDGTATLDVDVAGVGTYDVTYTYTDDMGCDAFQTVSVTINPEPVVTLNDPDDVCIDGSDMIFTATPVPGTLAGDSGVFTTTAGTGFTDHLDGTATLDVDVAGVGTYDVTYTYTDDMGCDAFQTVSVTINPEPVVTLSDPNDVCIDGSDMVFTATPVPGTLAGDSGVFTTTAGTGFTDNLDGTATLDVDVAGVGTYDVTYTYTDDMGCDAFQTVSVTINPEPVVTLNDPNDVCIDGSDMVFTATLVPGTLPGDSGVFTTTAGTGFTDNLDGTATLDVNVAGVGTYDVTYTYTDDMGCDAFQTVSVTINPEPVVTLNDPNDVCIDGSDMVFTATPVPGTLAGDSGVFTTTAGTGFTDHLDGTATLDVDVAGVGTYDVTYTYTDDNGCDAFQTVSVTINPEPVVTLNDPNDVCIDGSDMVFTATPVPGTLAGDSGVFTTTAGTGFTDHLDGTATLDVDVAGVGTYDVTYTYTDDNGCDAFQTVSVTINPEPVVTLNDPNDVCIDGSDMVFTATLVPGTLPGDSGVFTTTAGTGFTDHLDGTATLDVDVAGVGTYDVTYTYTDDNGCDAFQTVSVTINPEPVVTLNDPNDVCIDGSDMVFTATPVPGTLAGDSGVFTTTAGTGFMDNLDGTATLDVDVAGVGTYDVTYTYTDDMGCDAFQTVSVTINPEPVVTLNDPDDVCIDGSDMIFTATPVPGTLAGDSGVFTTTTGTGFTDNLDGTATLDVDIAGTGTYDVTYTYTDDNGCDAFQTVSVTINPEPVVTLNDPNDVCIDGSDMIFTATPVPGTLPGDSGVFTTTAGTGFTDHFDGTATLDVDVAGAGTYDVTYTYTDDNGCDAFQTVSVTINPEPVVTLNDPNDVCIDGSDMIFTATPVPGTLAGDSGVFTTTAGTGFMDNLDGTATLDVDVAGAGTYEVTYTYTDDMGCDAFQTVSVTINPEPVVTLNDPNDVCIDGSDMIFTATPVPGTLVGDSGVFTTTAGTGFMDNLDGTATLDVDVAGVGTYDVTYTYTDDMGCDAFQTVSVTINPEPVVTLNDPNDVCIDGSDMIFTATPVPGTLAGDSGVFTTTAGTGFMDNLDGTATLDVDVAGAGTYEVTYTYTDDMGCDAFQTVSVTINPEPVVTLNDPNDVCIDGSDMVFTATPVPGTLVGDSGVFTTTAGTGFTDHLDGTATLDVDVAGVGTYDVTYTYTDDNGCDAFQTVSVTINPEPVVTLNDPNDVCIDGSDMVFTATPVPGTLVGDSGVFTTTAGTGFTDHLDGTATLDVDVAGVGTYEVTYTYTDDNGCDAFQTVSVTINPEPVVTLNDPNDVCIDGSDMVFTATPVPGTLPGDRGVFTTTAGTGFMDNLDGTATLDVDVAGAGTYDVTYTYTDDNGCDAFQTVSVTINSIPEIDLEDQYVICLASDGTVYHPLTPTLLPNPPIDTGLSETEYNFQWYTGGEVIASNIIVGATQTSYSPTAAGDYTVLVTSIATSCSSAASTSVIESNPPENITIAVVYPAFSESNALLVSVSENGEYEYKLDDGFWQDSPRFDNVSGGEHIVYVRDIYYCNMISEIKLIITYPLFVTPNNDGYFDYWNVIGLDNQPDARIIIFDRYGKLLTVLSPLEVGWDGTYNGANMPSTDYWFTVEFVDPYDDARKIFRAHFALKR